MKALHKRFVLQLLVISVVMYAALYVVFIKFYVRDLPLLVMVALLFAINSLAFILITNTKDKKPRSFVYAFMGISIGRLVICAVFVISYALTHRYHAKAFVLTFFLMYFIYTLVEVRSLSAFFRK